jgi:c-di-GMP-binding flagellar brake protein YcgR
MEEVIMMSEIFSPGYMVQVELVNDAGTKIVSKATVHHMDDKQLILSISRWDEALRNQTLGNRMILVCKLPGKSNDYVFGTRFINFKSSPPLLTVDRPKETNFWKGRRFFRCDVNQVTMSYFKQNREFKDNQVVNLSSSGLYVMLDNRHAMEPGMELTCRISLPSMPSSFLFVGKVVRTQKHPDKQGIALHFQYPSPILQNQITKYLYNCQQSLIRQGKLKLLA